MNLPAISPSKERDVPRNMDQIMEQRVEAIVEERLNLRLNSLLDSLQQNIEGHNRARAQEIVSMTEERLRIFASQMAGPIEDMSNKLITLSNELHAIDIELATLAMAAQDNGVITKEQLLEANAKVHATAEKAVQVAEAAREAAKEMEGNFPESQIPPPNSI